MASPLAQFAETFLTSLMGVGITRETPPTIVLLVRDNEDGEWREMVAFENWTACDCINASAMFAKCGVALYAREQADQRYAEGSVQSSS